MIETETSSTAKAVYQSLDDLIDGMSSFAGELSGVAAVAMTEDVEILEVEPALDESEPVAEVTTKQKHEPPIGEEYPWHGPPWGSGQQRRAPGDILSTKP